MQIDFKDNPTSLNLNENLYIVGFSYFKSMYIESIKNIDLYTTRSVWSKTIQERHTSHEPSQMPKTVMSLGDSQHNGAAGLFRYPLKHTFFIICSSFVCSSIVFYIS